MMKKGLLLLLLATFTFFGYSQEVVIDNVIEKELRDEMSVRKSDELISVNIILKAQYDQENMRRKSDAYSTAEAKRAFVVNELKSFSRNEQASILDLLDNMSKSYEVRNLTTHWLANMITCDISAAVIEELATRKDVMLIGYNETQYLLFDEKPVEIAPSKEITQNVTQVNANDVWDLGYTGEGVVVAVIDTGVNYNHLDLADHLWDGGSEFPYHGWDFIGNDNNPMDDHGHGTHCSGTVCGDGTAGSQTGMAPDATLMCVKVLDAGGNGNLDQIIGGMEFAVENGAHLFSMSLGFANPSTSEKLAFRNVCVNALEAGVAGAIAAGNEGDSQGWYPIPDNVRAPGGCPPPWLHPDQTTQGGTSCCICVGAVDYNDQAAYFTSHGPTTWQNISEYGDYPYNPGMGLIRPDVCAPGVDIKSLNYSGNTGYTSMSGTSMATPCVAGVIALMLSKNDQLSPAEIDEILETTGLPLTPTKSNIYGSARIDALAAVQTVSAGPIKFISSAVNDEAGNNDGLMNPGETVSFSLTFRNESTQNLNNITFDFTSNSAYVNITNATTTIESIPAGQYVTVENALTAEILENAEPTKNITFSFTGTATGVETSRGNFKIMTYGNIINIASVAIDDSESGNGNNVLDPGETADVYVYVANSGNISTNSMIGTLSSTDENLTINTNDKLFGILYNDATRYAHYNVTLSESATPLEAIPAHITLADNAENAYDMDFVIASECEVLFSLSDSYGDGWNGAAIIVSFSDGTPNQSLTIASGNSSAEYYITVTTGTEISLTWQAGSWDSECSFVVSYVDGDQIYSGSGAQSGTFYTWTANCAGGGSAEYCEQVQNVTVTPNINSISLTWDEQTEAHSYTIYRDNELIVGGLRTNTYTDENLTDGIYCYTMEVKYLNGCYSEPIEPICVTLINDLETGDVNGDGEINVADIVAIVAYMLEQNPSPFFVEIADVNGDGQVNVLDIMAIVNIIMQ